MIRFEHVTRRYEVADRPALDDVTVEFNRGEFVFLIGASGSGKSTLLRMILREGLPQKGRITVAGQNLGLMLERRVPDYRRSVGMVFQDFRLLPDKTVYDNVAFAMRVIGARRSQIRKRVTKVLERVNLDHLAKRYPHEISGGEQQRAAIARAIVNEPAILLADEPTGNLDPRASAEVMKILRWINASGTTVIMATHDRAIVDRMQRRVVQLHRGGLVRDEPRGSYDPPRDSEAWTILLEEERESGAWSPTDPKALGASEERAGSAEPADPAQEDAEEVPEADGAGVSSEDQPEEREEPARRRKRPARRRRSGRTAKQEKRDLAAAASEEKAAEQTESADTTSGEEPSAPAEGLPEQIDDSEFLSEEDVMPESTGIRVVWPADGRQAAADALPEPTGDFSGAELPDLDRDGYIEPDSAPGPADDPTDEIPAAGSEPQEDHEERSDDSEDDAGPAEDQPPSPPSPRVAEAARRAAEVAAPQSAAEPAERPGPRMSWLAHAGGKPVDRAGDGPEIPAPESGAEDRRLAEQDAEAEPPVQTGPPEPAGRGPQPQEEPAEDMTAEDETARQKAAEAADTAEEDPASAGVDDLEKPQSGPENSSPKTVPRPIPRPKSSASQTSYTDKQRTAEQLGVSSKRSFLRRLRRDG